MHPCFTSLVTMNHNFKFLGMHLRCENVKTTNDLCDASLLHFFSNRESQFQVLGMHLRCENVKAKIMVSLETIMCVPPNYGNH